MAGEVVVAELSATWSAGTVTERDAHADVAATTDAITHVESTDINLVIVKASWSAHCSIVPICTTFGNAGARHCSARRTGDRAH